jgi:hypothetical protein
MNLRSPAGIAPPQLPAAVRWMRMAGVVGAGLFEWLALWRTRRRGSLLATSSEAERLRRALR